MTAYLVALVVALAVLNLLNNRLAPQFYTRTCLVAAALLLGSARGVGLTTADLGLSVRRLPSAAGWSAVLIAVVALGVLVLARHPRWRKALYDDRAGRLTGREVVFQSLVRIPLGTVLLEEMAFRGVLFAAIAHDHGAVAATVGSSLLFGMWHLLPSAALTEGNQLARSRLGTGRSARLRGAVVAVVVTAVVGVGLCWLRIATDSLLTPAALHCAANVFGLVAAWLLRDARPRPQIR